MTTFTDVSEAIIERKKRVKLLGEFKEKHIFFLNHPCQVMEDGRPDRKLFVFKGLIDIKPEDRCVIGTEVYDVVSIQKHTLSGENETVAVGDRDQFESGIRKLEEKGCDIKYGRVVPTAKDPGAEEFMDAWVGTFIKNIVDHYSEIKRGRHIGELFALFNHDVPAVCVGAGPSLDKNAHLLYEFPGIIIVTDRAYKMVRARGIDPDFVINLDCHYDIVPDYLDCPGTENHILIANTCADPRITKVWKGKIFWFTMRHPGVQFMDRILPALFPTFGSIENAGNVGNASVLFADHVGFSPIILIGQDYGYTGGRMCARQYKFSRTGKATEVPADHKRLMEERSGKIEVDGITTYPPFLTYRDTLYGLKNRNSLEIINCTEGGILKGLPCAPFSDIIDQLEPKMKSKSLEAKTFIKNFRR